MERSRERNFDKRVSKKGMGEEKGKEEIDRRVSKFRGGRFGRWDIF